VSLRDDPACDEIVELVTAYLEDALPVTDRARFERHLAECDGCAVYLDQMRLTIRLTGRLPRESLPPAAREAFLTLLRKWKREGGALA
jgi:anti-sigma factor RsiW